jgi:succinoglycan biosynthesis protein ExoV
MKIYAYQAPRGNLGDDLNHWLWPRLLTPSFLEQDGTFIGIGSVLHPDHFRHLPSDRPAVVFGAGCRSGVSPLSGSHPPLDIRALRGPLSSRALGLESSASVIDGAYALQFTPEYQTLRQMPVHHECTLIPYFRSSHLAYYSWIRALYGYSVLYSDNYGSIPSALQHIARSRLILAESLHGAILADCLRIPWMRIQFYLQRPSERETGDFKWEDWRQSLNIETIPTIRVPLDKSEWVSQKKGQILAPYRTLRYLRALRKKKNFVLSPEYRWREQSEILFHRLQELLR